MTRVALATLLLSVLACDAEGDVCVVSERAALSVEQRFLVGEAQPYIPDATLRGRAEALRVSQRARREEGWRLVGRMLEPVPIEHAASGAPATLPRFRTWYTRDDVTRLFRKLHGDLDDGSRASCAPFGVRALDEAFAWNAETALTLPGGAERLATYAASIGDEARASGLGGIERVAYSPEAARHLLSSYGQIAACTRRPPPPAFSANEPGATRRMAHETDSPETCEARRFDPEAGANWAPCLDGAFPLGAVLVKADFRRVGFGFTLPTYDTSAAALRRRRTGDGSWTTPDGTADPGPDAIHTIALDDGSRYRLAALHVMSKELDHWLWVTLFFSTDPDSDFGADRPSSIEGPWASYKMCVVTAFDEGDPDPRGGVDSPSLADALAAVHEGQGGPSWCSNPYLERGAHNAETNCIGCHQHAGAGIRPESIPSTAALFPDQGRLEARNNFPTDYAFAVNEGDRWASLFADATRTSACVGTH